jgi:hypothetical protein
MKRLNFLVHMAQLNGDTEAVSNLVDNNGAVSFDIDVDEGLGGSRHIGTVTCDRPVRIVSEQWRDGEGRYEGSVSGNVYSWMTDCRPSDGIHYTIHLAY